jgi:hypothetical protein
MNKAYKDPYSIDDLDDNMTSHSDEDFSVAPAIDDTFVDDDDDVGLKDFELPDDDEDEIGEEEDGQKN